MREAGVGAEFGFVPPTLSLIDDWSVADQGSHNRYPVIGNPVLMQVTPPSPGFVHINDEVSENGYSRYNGFHL